MYEEASSFLAVQPRVFDKVTNSNSSICITIELVMRNVGRSTNCVRANTMKIIKTKYKSHSNLYDFFHCEVKQKEATVDVFHCTCFKKDP